MIKQQRYRIYPTKEQQAYLLKCFGSCRFVYNHFLELRNTLYEDSKKSLSAYEMMSQLPELKRRYEWLKEICAQSLQIELMHLDNAFTAFFRKTADYPKFKSRSHSRASISFPQDVRFVDDNHIRIPKLRQSIKIVLSRPISGKIKTATISKNSSEQYFVSFVIDDGLEAPQKEKTTPEGTIGIDLGIKHFATFSTGEKVKNPRTFSKLSVKLAREQRKLSRMQKGSNNRAKQKLRVARIYQKIANRRADFLHKLTYRLTHESQVNTICIENLSVKELLEEKLLSRQIADASWSEFRRLLTYKCDWYGKNLIVIDRYAPSSKLCAQCGKINNNLTLADRTWTCSCGVVYDRDINAAQNIRRFGLEYYHRTKNLV